MNKIIEKGEEVQVIDAISEGLQKLKKEASKEDGKDEVDLVSITKKLSAKKFGKKR